MTPSPLPPDHAARLARARIGQARRLPASYAVATAASVLGNGTRLSAQDTVPFTLWALARHLDSFEDALWTTVSALGDRDTTCAIVGGIAALLHGEAALPAPWLAAAEPIRWPATDALPR